MKRAWPVAFLFCALVALTGCKTLSDAIEGLEPQGGAVGSTAEDGLREALRVGTSRAVEALSREGGYLRDSSVRIPLPEKLAKAGEAVRRVGLGSIVEDFEESMNRAAEEAAPLARPVFLDAIRGMTFDDAMRILRGDAHEATDYFQAKTSERLTGLYRPKVAEKLREVGATREFDALMSRASQIPFLDAPPIDLADYVTAEALEGLFEKLGEEERKIREDPVARSTELLRRWFGS